MGATQFVTKAVISNISEDKSNKPVNSINSQVNFKVKGRAKKHRHIRTILMAKLGATCDIPTTSVVSLVPTLF